MDKRKTVKNGHRRCCDNHDAPLSIDAGGAMPAVKEALEARREPQSPEMAIPMNARETIAIPKAS